MLSNFDKQRIADEYRRLSMLIGKIVTVCKVEKEDRTAKVCDIDEKCRLVVEYQDGQKETLDSGEVRIKW